jgi:hypothetical protein
LTRIFFIKTHLNWQSFAKTKQIEKDIEGGHMGESKSPLRIADGKQNSFHKNVSFFKNALLEPIGAFFCTTQTK